MGYTGGMRYLLAETGVPFRYLSCGQLLSKRGFLHPRRTIDSTVFIYVNEGTLYITQDGRQYEIRKNQFIVLYENHPHWGWKKSEAMLSYYWVHFCLPGRYQTSYDRGEIQALIGQHKQWEEEDAVFYLFPETGTIASDGKLPLLFGQLLDYGSEKSGGLRPLQRYSLSLLLLELTRESVGVLVPESTCKPVITRVQRWIHSNYRSQMSVQWIASIFQYNPDYLSAEFKRQAGISLCQYISKTRIDIAKNLLSFHNLSIKDAAYSAGFMDEKYFTRVFKRLERLTPLEYKRAFSRKKILSNNGEDGNTTAAGSDRNGLGG